MARELNEVGVVGLGTMGAGIAEVMARAGLSVTAVEVTDSRISLGIPTKVRFTGRGIVRVALTTISL